MAVNALQLGGARLLKFLSAAVAALLALPGLVFAQAQRISNEWLQLTPTDPRAGIPADPRTSVTLAGSAPTVSIERRWRGRGDSAASVTTFEASKRDPHLHVVVSLDDRKLWVVVGADTVLEAPVAIGSGETLVFG